MSGGENGGRPNGVPRVEPAIGYLSRVELDHVRSIASLRWEVTPGPGWNVILGDNGSGKSTFLRALAWLLLPSDEEAALRVNLPSWTRSETPAGMEVRVSFSPGEMSHRRRVRIERVSVVDEASHPVELRRLFVAGFGPFRRFTGGEPEYEKQFDAFPRVARVVSLFDERFSLGESLAWLKLLRFKELEGDAPSAALLASLRAFVNQDGFLPSGARLDRITSESVLFVDPNGAEVPVDELSDGYRSILSLTFELVRQLAVHFGAGRVFSTSAKAVVAPGIILIDEVDAHLHPSWQRRIGVFLRRCFPSIQFVVTTHSPLVCQAAEVGTVFRLPRPGTDEEAHMIRGADLDRLLYGDLADAFATDAMGAIGRSEKAQALLVTLAALNRKEIDQGLTDEERREQRRLRAMFPAARESAT